MSDYQMRIIRGVTVVLTTVAMAVQSQLLVAAVTTAATTKAAPKLEKTATTPRTVQAPRDVVLRDNGVLLGRVVDVRGAAVAKTPVSLQTGGKEVARVLSDDLGRFEAKGLKGGVYQVASIGHQGVYRLWAPHTAPPAAAKGLSIISQPVDVVRGQMAVGGPFARAGQWIAEHPIVTAGAIATAIAVPIALEDDDPPATP